MGQHVFNPHLNLITLGTTVEGRDGRSVYLRMVLDTGASFTIIPWSAAEALGYHPANSSDRVQFMTGSGREAAPLLMLKGIEVLGVRLRQVPVLCHDLPQGSLVDGLLGLSFLRRCRLFLDFQDGVLQLEKGVSEV